METKDYPSGDARDESAGRRAALFNRHVRPHLDLVYSLCIRYSYSAADIEDNYSEALANFYKYIETYDPSRSIQTWLHIVTKRFVGDMNNRNGSFRRTEDVNVADIPDTIAGDNGCGGNCMDMDNYRSLYNDDILEALERIKPIYREALLLQQAGYKLHEIMEITYRNGSLRARNLDTVKSRLFLAKKQMKKLINRDGEARED